MIYVCQTWISRGVKMKLTLHIILICTLIILKSKGQSDGELKAELNEIKSYIALKFKKIEMDMKKSNDKVKFQIHKEF